MSGMKPVVRFDQVSKRFILHQNRPRSFQEMALNLFRRRSADRDAEVFWALQGVSFEIAPGETLGLVGPNGAGKSTALKLIAGVLEPTAGRVEVQGRIGALLELGTGFHPDLTGRENIYLNGSILGLSRATIRRKLDEIIAFAELERFIDVPVKHYSSGMYMRLGFAVAVHVDPEILLVDEVLAVGDGAFQRKCLERINQLRSQGVTVFFVSHSAETVRAICSRALWLEKGRVIADSTADTVVAAYLDHSQRAEEMALMTCSNNRQWGSKKAQIVAVHLKNIDGEEQRQFRVGDTFILEIQYYAPTRIEQPIFGLGIHRNDGLHIAGPNTHFGQFEIPWIEGRGYVQYKIHNLPLLEGFYYISVAIHSRDDAEMYDYHDRLYPLRVLSSGGEGYGIVTLKGEWSWVPQEGKTVF